MRRRHLRGWTGGNRPKFRNGSNISDGAWRSAGVPGAQASKNGLARAVFFNRLGELRDRSFEDPRYRASDLNLAVAAIILWDTVDFGRAIHALKAAGHTVDDTLLQHLSPVGWGSTST